TRRRPAPPGAAARPGAGQQAPPDAGQVLLLAARHTAGTATMDARPNQFLFIDSVEVESKIDLDRSATTLSGPLRTRTWLSVDGTRDGLVIQQSAKSPVRTHLDGCTNGRQAQTIDRPETTPKVACTPQPAYQPGGVPTDPDRLLAQLYAIAADQPEWVAIGAGPDRKPRGFVRLSADQRAFTEIAEILYRNHLPAVQEAAFRAAGRIAGVQVRRGATDAAGRGGVAVTRTEAGTREELVFDPVTYTYLGHNIIGAEFDPAGAHVVSSLDRAGKIGRVSGLGLASKPGEVVHQSALLRVAIVDRAGRRP
ncbi:CU044_5270 family protein, partial [Actinoplanes sp. NPDC026623]|uniref:CU044_5270 family protein n=1 Tax=Actinoplanes sp. NPDC026623 TaxID=3155610 RepID=UPI0033CE611D